jgi:hypothetical protein
MPQFEEPENDDVTVAECPDDQDERLESLDTADEIANFLLECEAIVIEALNIRMEAEAIVTEASYLSEPFDEAIGDDGEREDLSAIADAEAVIACALAIQSCAYTDSSASTEPVCTEPQPAEGNAQAPQETAVDPPFDQESPGEIKKPVSSDQETTQEERPHQNCEVTTTAPSNQKSKRRVGSDRTKAESRANIKRETDDDG